MRHRLVLPLLALSGLLLASCRSAPAAVAQTLTLEPPPRPLVLVVHGRGQFGRDTAVMRREAYVAMKEGMRPLAPADTLREEDVRLVWYADALAHPGEARCERAVRASAVGEAMTFLALATGALLDEVAADRRSGDALELRSFAGDLRYMGDAASRCAAEARVGRALDEARRDGRPVLLVAHSLGGLVTWGHLSNRAPSDSLPEIVRLVTVGSVIGAPEVRQLVFGARAARVELPGRVRGWVNVVAEGDPLAAAVLGASGPVTEVRTEIPRVDPHELTGYLRDPATARALREAWEEARRR